MATATPDEPTADQSTRGNETATSNSSPQNALKTSTYIEDTPELLFPLTLCTRSVVYAADGNNNDVPTETHSKLHQVSA